MKKKICGNKLAKTSEIISGKTLRRESFFWGKCWERYFCHLDEEFDDIKLHLFGKIVENM